MYFYHAHPSCRTPSNSSTTSWLTHMHVPFLLKHIQSNLCCLKLIDTDPCTGVWSRWQETHPYIENWVCLSKQLSVCNIPLSNFWDFLPMWTLHAGVLSGLSLPTSFAYVKAVLRSYVWMPCYCEKMLFVYSHPPLQPLIIILVPFLWSSLTLGRVRYDRDPQFSTEHSIVSYSLELDYLWISPLIITFYRMLLWYVLKVSYSCLRWQLTQRPKTGQFAENQTTECSNLNGTSLSYPFYLWLRGHHRRGDRMLIRGRRSEWL